jgi:hypothetical protein
MSNPEYKPGDELDTNGSTAGELTESDAMVRDLADILDIEAGLRDALEYVDRSTMNSQELSGDGRFTNLAGGVLRKTSPYVTECIEDGNRQHRAEKSYQSALAEVDPRYYQTDPYVRHVAQSAVGMAVGLKPFPKERE